LLADIRAGGNMATASSTAMQRDDMALRVTFSADDVSMWLAKFHRLVGDRLVFFVWRVWRCAGWHGGAPADGICGGNRESCWKDGRHGD